MLSNRSELDFLEYVNGTTTLQRKEYRSSRGREFKGPCPLCGGKDRFWVHPDHLGGRWYCRQCNPKGGGLISLVMMVENLPYNQAVQRCGQKYGLSFKSRRQPTSSERRYPKDMTREKWQDTTIAYVQRAHDYLFGQEGEPMLNWLKTTRGLDEEIIFNMMIGVSPKQFVLNDIRFHRGLTIPHMEDKRILAVKVRTNSGYLHIKGGQSNLYMAERVPHAPKLDIPWQGNTLVLVESELDALLLYSVVARALRGDDLSLQDRLSLACTSIVALGGSQRASLQWKTLCQSTYRRVIATDNDEAGDKLAEDFKGMRLRPTEKDPGEMWLKGGDSAILEWLMPALVTQAEKEEWEREGMNHDPHERISKTETSMEGRQEEKVETPAG